MSSDPTPGLEYQTYLLGAFAFPEDRRQHWAQFLFAVEREGRVVLEDLRDTILPAFEQAVGEDRERLQSGPGALSHERRAAITKAVLPIVEEWMKRFHFGARKTAHAGGSGLVAKFVSWFRETAFRTLGAWTTDLAARGALRWEMPHDLILVRGYASVSFQAGAWDVLQETRGTAEERIEREIREQVQRYLNEMVLQATSEGLTPRPRERQREAFEILVRYQVLGESRNTIAAHMSVSRQTTQRTIREMATLLMGPEYDQWLRKWGE